MKEIRKILEGKVIAGHSLQNDFKVLEIDPEQSKIRDVSKHYKFKGPAG